MTAPLLELRGVSRRYLVGDGEVNVLVDINLSIAPGEMLAIVGSSGSGKSTLLHILGCLDRSSSGTYYVAGRAIDSEDADTLAALRRENFGFVFQRYNLLAHLSVEENVALPAAYAGSEKMVRLERARVLLQRFGLADRCSFRPAQLSGGQQQRASIARALMNGGAIILADEPTGALDSASGEEVMQVLGELNRQGHTVVLVTHDHEVAAHARRIVEIRDGKIVSDRTRESATEKGGEWGIAEKNHSPATPRRAAWVQRHLEAWHMAWVALNARRLRSALTMLGILIGIASVASIVAIGEGARNKVLDDIRRMGTNTITVFPGTGWGDMQLGHIKTLTAADAHALRDRPYVDSITETVNASATVRSGKTNLNMRVVGVGAMFFRVHGFEFVSGQPIHELHVRARAQAAVVEEKAARQMFGAENALGKTLLIGKTPVEIIGVIKDNQHQSGGALSVWLPYSAVHANLTGTSHLDSIVLRLAEGSAFGEAEKEIAAILLERHVRKDFFVESMDKYLTQVESTTQNLNLGLALVAAVSLFVGGIGVMNMMLVSVAERTREIGIRMAIGARRSDILRQFLIEAVMLCALGGAAGLVLATMVTQVASRIFQFGVVMSWPSVLAACSVACLTGLLCGFIPARNAARCDPVMSLMQD